MVICIVVTNNYANNFTKEKWEKYPDKRDKIINDFLENYYYDGMEETEIISLLGHSEGETEGYFANKINNKEYDLQNTLVYYVGEDIMDSKWLAISVLEGKCIEATICIR